MKRALALAFAAALVAGSARADGFANFTLVQAANVVTASDGTFAVTWTVPFSTPTPFVSPHYIGAAGTQPVTCQVITSTATGMTGKCFSGQTVALTLANVTAGLTVLPFAASAGGLTVQVLGRDTTQ